MNTQLTDINSVLQQCWQFRISAIAIFFCSVKVGLPRPFFPKRSIQNLLDSESLFVLAIGLGKLHPCDVEKVFDSTEPISTSFRNDWNSLGHLAAKYPYRIIAVTRRRLFLKD